MWGMKICSDVPGHMTVPIFGEKLKKSSSSEPKADHLETWYTASGTRDDQCFHMMTLC